MENNRAGSDMILLCYLMDHILPSISYCQTTDRLLGALIQQARSGDVVLIMSNGGFDHLHRRLLASLD